MQQDSKRAGHLFKLEVLSVQNETPGQPWSGSDAVMLEATGNGVELGVRLALQNIVHTQHKWDIRKDVQVCSLQAAVSMSVKRCAAASFATDLTALSCLVGEAATASP